MPKAKRRGGRKRKTTSVKRLTRMVKSMRPEVKEKVYQYTDVNGTSYNNISYGSSTPNSLLCGGISQGVADGQRIGDKIKLIGIKVHFAFTHANADLYNNIRWLLIRPKTDRNSVGGTLTQNIFSGAASGGTQWCSPVDTDRYRVLYDKSYNLYNRPNDGSTTTTIQPTRFFKKFFKVRANMQWDAEGNLTRDYILLAISDSAASPHPGVVAGHVKLYYVDN